MSAFDAPRPIASGPALADTSPVSQGRLVRVELRKLMDTRAGTWLRLGIALLTAAVVVIFMFAAEPSELTFTNFVNATSMPQAILLPVLGILAVTSEWGQRTRLVTFTLEPHRGRVVVVKLAAALVLGAAAVVVAIGLAALANASVRPRSTVTGAGRLASRVCVTSSPCSWSVSCRAWPSAC